MSDAVQAKAENKESQTDVPISVHSPREVTKVQDSPGITINFYSPNYSPKSDKPVQTEPSCTALVAPNSSRKPTTLASDSSEIQSFDYGPVTGKKPYVKPHEIRQHKLMNPRKFSDNKATARTGTDLERKKLEAELKATEEIAKLQQTVIEKRLALELASLQEGTEYHHKNITPQPSLPHADLRVIEEVTRKQNVLEYQQSQDMGSVDWSAGQSRPQSPRSPTPARAPANEGGKFSLRADSSLFTQTSSDLNPLRNLIEKKINLERRSSKASDLKLSPPPTDFSSSHRSRNTSPDTRQPRTSQKNPAHAPPGPHGGGPQDDSHSRSRSLWKSAMTKMKKKLKPPSKASADQLTGHREATGALPHQNWTKSKGVDGGGRKHRI